MEVTKGIHQFSGVSNSYIVSNNEILLVDTGMPGKSGEIIDYVKNELKRDPSDIKTIVITHHHFDHTGSLDKLKEITGAKVAIHSADADYISGEKTQHGSLFMIPVVMFMKIIYRSRPVKADIILEDGDEIGDYRVIHTPGHTSGGICLYNPNNKVLFVGDNLMYTNNKIEGPRVLHEPEMYKKSIEKLKNLDINLILTGHGQAITSEANNKLETFLTELDN
jgi:glyoxylase-like metal-dependent hydrolase (beta-lactamase superfamily II)